MSGFSVFDQVVQLPPRRVGGTPRGVPKRFPVHEGRVVAQRRLACGMTQERLADLAGFCREVVRRVEAGMRVRSKTRDRVLHVLRQAERGRR